MTCAPRVTVCVPVYNGAAFVGETLEAVARQRYDRLAVAVSDDGSTDDSERVCLAFAADRRFTVTRQPSRLGWVEHCNWMLRRVTTEYACLVSHDDMPEPDHIARLVAVLDSRPDCALAYSDVRVFGLLDKVEHQPPVDGATAAERARLFIATHFDGTAFHALVRRSALEAVGGLTANDMDHFAADVTWLGRLTRAGAFHRVPEPLYGKRRHAASASLQWATWTADELAEGWLLHCRELLHDALAPGPAPEDRRALLRAAERRLLAIEPALPFPFIRDYPAARRADMARRLLDGHGA